MTAGTNGIATAIGREEQSTRPELVLVFDAWGTTIDGWAVVDVAAESHLLRQCAARRRVGPIDWERIALMAEESKGKSGRLGRWREKRRERRARRRRVDAKKVAQAGRANVDDAMKRGGMGH